MHFVDQVDLEASTARRILHVVEQLAGIFNLGAAGSIDFDQVDKTAFINLFTNRTDAAGRRADAGLAIQALGNNSRNRGLAHTTGTREQIGMVQSLAIERINQRLEHMRLANHFVERARTPLACKNLITHRNPSREESKKVGLILTEHGANCIQCAAYEWPTFSIACK